MTDGELSISDATLIARLREGATWDDDVAAADRIEQLVATNEALTAKLAKAVKALEDLVRDCEADYPPSHGAIKHFARATLAEIKGERHE